MNSAEFLSTFVDDISNMGVRPGSVLMVHPSLRAFGYVPGGAETIIRGLLRVLGESGTLLMPALSYKTVTPQNPVFDVRATPSCVGAVAEAFRLRAGTLRSLHPTHSVCAVGPLADELLSPHIEDSTPCGKHSPFNRLPEFNGKILMLACRLTFNTSMHAIEEILKPPYLFDPPISYSLRDKAGQVLNKEYFPHNFRGWQQRYDRIEKVMTAPSLYSGTVVGVTSHLIESRVLWEEAMNALKIDKLFFVNTINA